MRHALLILCHGWSSGPGLGGILSFFFDRKDDFREVLDFVHATDKQYGLQLQQLHGDFKQGIQQLTSCSGIKGIFLGTRRCAHESRYCYRRCMHGLAEARSKQWAFTRRGTQSKW